jgi:hypothetical protein
MVGVVLLLFQAQDHPSIEVGEDRFLGQGGPAHPLAESHLSADASNPNHLLVGVIQFTSPMNGWFTRHTRIEIRALFLLACLAQASPLLRLGGTHTAALTS